MTEKKKKKELGWLLWREIQVRSYEVGGMKEREKQRLISGPGDKLTLKSRGQLVKKISQCGAWSIFSKNYSGNATVMLICLGAKIGTCQCSLKFLSAPHCCGGLWGFITSVTFSLQGFRKKAPLVFSGAKPSGGGEKLETWITDKIYRRAGSRWQRGEKELKENE